ncbi:MAG: 4Fe-4S dicluster domain-containing protein [Lachnospiraceae bacterium]|nr:4Fe-4S dicluster domain-containing protein [Lachnospiraceae bacterium]
MNKFYHSVYLQEDRCIGCFSCLKRCPTQAIRIRNGKSSIIPEFCIDCGECTRQCPHHAKRCRRDQFENIRSEFSWLVALPAPALYSQFNRMEDVNIILTAILLSGFDDVFEVSAGAEIVSAATREYITAHPEQWPLISTACPTIERLIRVRFPNLIDHMLPILPPMEAAAQLARERAIEKTGLPSEKIGIVFISPCPSKVAFTRAPLGLEKSNVDRVIGIKDYYPILLSHMKEAEKNIQPLGTSGRLGKGWAISGGEAYGIRSNEYLAADGIENVIHVLEDLEDEKFERGLHFVELNSCSAGCVGGVLNVENAYLAKTKTKRMSQNEPDTRPDSDVLGQHDLNAFGWSEPITYEPVYRLGENIFESMENMEKVETILEALPGLDCGCCGSPTCKALATDIVTSNRDATIGDCIFLTRDMS